MSITLSKVHGIQQYGIATQLKEEDGIANIMIKRSIMVIKQLE